MTPGQRLYTLLADRPGTGGDPAWDQVAGNVRERYEAAAVDYRPTLIVGRRMVPRRPPCPDCADLRATASHAVARYQEATRDLAARPDALSPPDPIEARLLVDLLAQEHRQLAAQRHHDDTWKAWRDHRVQLIERARARLQGMLEGAPVAPAGGVP